MSPKTRSVVITSNFRGGGVLESRTREIVQHAEISWADVLCLVNCYVLMSEDFVSCLNPKTPRPFYCKAVVMCGSQGARS